MLYWSKVIGLLSIKNEDRIINMLKHYIDNQKNPQSISEPAAIYFTSMRYIRISHRNQEKWLAFFLPYLQHQHKKTPDTVLSSLLLTLCNVFRQCDFTKSSDKTLVLKLAETNELLKKLAEKKNSKISKKTMLYYEYLFLLRSPEGLFKTLQQFLDKRCLAYLDETDKCEQCLDMLIYLFHGTYDPFCSFFSLNNNDKMDIDWNQK